MLSRVISAGVSASIRTRSYFNDLKDFTPILIAVGLTFVFKAFLIALVDRLTFDFTISLYRLSPYVLTAVDYRFLPPPIDGS